MQDESMRTRESEMDASDAQEKEIAAKYLIGGVIMMLLIIIFCCAFPQFNPLAGQQQPYPWM